MGAADGLSLAMIGKLFGHAQASTTERYAHLAADPQRQATERMGRRVAEALNGTAKQSGEILPLTKRRKPAPAG